ncbi:RidA family protein [Kibdelosporangium aridum]|uniref:Enamine deaminase RidA, house cleaning of reactive enamine intermediates, YjgF/YER057c/UK114 family n=1 Tax=Kibdelosporangium aridum TaxID=2030 RepID=A0A1W2F9B9_KIBAR|nr:RidA family protein [Kibdelosporangium aridum]SMD18453.1 Enamine deaminase RidA, house cleaning of reactive enamine intermediates, YjgF/YER057c/UK114 family [Kibdelosporangium aridum]
MPIHDRINDVAGNAPGFGYAHAVTTSGRLAFVSGQVALDENGQLVGQDNLAAQTRQALRNLENVLKQLGATWADVVRFNWYMVDTSELPIVREIRDEFIRPVLGDRPNPASTLIQVAGLFRPECLIEVDAVVSIP